MKIVRSAKPSPEKFVDKSDLNLIVFEMIKIKIQV